MSFTPTQYKAIALYAERYNATPQLSTPQTIRFLDKRTGEMKDVGLNTLVREYENHKKEIARERARAKREESR